MPLVADTSSLIHDFYATEAEEGDPIHLVVDTRLLEDSIQIRGYTSSPVLIQNEPLANLFHECKVILQSTEAEAIVGQSYLFYIIDTPWFPIPYPYLFTTASRQICEHR